MIIDKFNSSLRKIYVHLSPAMNWPNYRWFVAEECLPPFDNTI